MSENGFSISAGPPDASGKRVVVATLGKLRHRDRLDINDAYKRGKFRDAIIRKFDWDDNAHEAIESKLSAAAEVDNPPAVANLVCMADVEAKQTKWHWENYIPAGAPTVLSSDPGEGKSTIATDLIARNSRGDCPPPCHAPDGTSPRGDSLLIQGEDDVERTSAPRLLAAGADMSRVHLLRTVTVCDESRQIQLPMDLPTIEQVIVENQINLVVVDVLSAFTESGVSLNDDAHMRRLFNPLSAVAERTQAAWLLIAHLNKKTSSPALYRSGGSIAIVGAARAAFTVGPHPDDPDQKVFCATKHNLGPRPASLTYSIEAHGSSSRIVWGGAVDLTASDVLGQHDNAKGGKVELAKSIINEILTTGPRGSNEVETACLDAGVSRGTYWTARRAMGVRAEKTNFDGNWLLSLPSTNGHAHDDF